MTKTDPKYFRDQLSKTYLFVASLCEDPVLKGRRTIATFFVVLAVVGVIMEETSPHNTFALSETAAFILLVLAWILYSKTMVQKLIGMFLCAIFLVSIVFLILPVEDLANDVTEAAGKVLTAQQQQNDQQNLVSNKIRDATGLLTSFVSIHPDLANDYNLTTAEAALTAAAAVSPTHEQGADNLFLQLISVDIARLLKQSAPFIFTLLMGLMGSAIAVSRQFVGDYSKEPAIWYLYRLLQGMIIALLVVYGLVAGMLSLGVSASDKAINIAEFDRNKYFIGFISALAGLFSEHAFAKLEAVSANVFAKTPKTLEQAQSNESAAKTPVGDLAGDHKEGI